MNPQLSITHLTHRFDAGTAGEKLALDDVSLTVLPGEFITLLGSNGAGKSTLFNALLGKFVPDRGRILLCGEDITRMKDYRRAYSIGCLFQNPLRGTAPHMTIEENLALAYTRKASRSFFAVNKKENAYFRDQLALLDMGLEDRMTTRMGLLSGGQRQAAALLMATIAKPKLLLLDEHTAALDPAASKKVMTVTRRIIEENHLTALMITHDMQQALSYGSRTLMMDRGRMALDLHGKAREGLTPRLLADLFVEATHGALSDRTLLSL